MRDRAETYRLRAEELRANADGMQDIGCRNMLLRLAASYDKMAQQAEEKAAKVQKEGDSE